MLALLIMVVGIVAWLKIGDKNGSDRPKGQAVAQAKGLISAMFGQDERATDMTPDEARRKITQDVLARGFQIPGERGHVYGRRITVSISPDMERAFQKVDQQVVVGQIIDGLREAAVREGLVVPPQVTMYLVTKADLRGKSTRVDMDFLEEETPATRRFQLRWEGSDQPHFDVPVDGREVTVGRASTADWAVDSPLVSGRHLRVRIDEGGTPVIVDNKSTNGTTVNGVRIGSGEPRTVADGDQIGLGPDVRLRVRWTRG
ncbi:MAG: FHA domain-containing protein [Aeromicrobium sp.]|uniref:FHA domain-containing protein n=1 Tax=Aeromicrobium sp. TaxID=1871063 RepID=UPI0039E5D9C2